MTGRSPDRISSFGGRADHPAGHHFQARIIRVGKQTLLAAVATAVALICVEGLARAYLRLRPPVGNVGRWQYRSTRPPAYQAADYFSKDFLTESMTCQRNCVNPPNTNFFVPGDYDGNLFHVSDGRRRTEFQPTASDHRVLLFGGSTAFCAEIPDTETIASQLQRLVNQSRGPRLKVENYGVPSMIADQQLGRLRSLALRPGDTVIFYDGVNDVIHPVYNGNPRGWLPGDSQNGGLRQLNLLERGMHRAFVRFGDRSALIRLLFNVQQRALPLTIADAQTLDANIGRAEVGYRAALAAAHEFASRSGATFFHFVQPNIFTLANPSAHERWLIGNELKSLTGLDHAMTIAYPRLRKAAAQACGSSNFDISNVLDEHGSSGEVYLDFCHVNHVANGIIARKIFESVFASRRSSATAEEAQAARSTDRSQR